MPDSDRVSIWSIARYWGVVYYILFSVQIAGIIGLVGWREIFRNTDDTAVDTVIAISLGVSPHVVTVAAETLVIVLMLEGITMLAERYLKRRFEKVRRKANRRELNWARRLARRQELNWAGRRSAPEAESMPQDFVPGPRVESRPPKKANPSTSLCLSLMMKMTQRSNAR